MNYAKAQKDVLTQLIKNSKAVVNCTTSETKVVLIVNGVLGFVFPDDLNWIDVDRIEAVCSLQNLHLPFMDAKNKLEPTENLIDNGSVIAREFKKIWHDGGAKSIYIQEQYLKNFDSPTFYQDINSWKGLVAITEFSELEGEILVGFVMPYQRKENA